MNGGRSSMCVRCCVFLSQSVRLDACVISSLCAEGSREIRSLPRVVIGIVCTVNYIIRVFVDGERDRFIS